MSIASRAALAALWQAVGLPPDSPAHIDLPGTGPELPSSFSVADAAQASIGASALAAAELWRLRSGRMQQVRVDRRAAAVEFRSERYLRVDGQQFPDSWDAIAGAYPCGDGRWVRLHTNFPHHREGVLKLLDCAYDRESVAAALQGWQAEAFESAATERGLVVAAVRTFPEWDTHPHRETLLQQPVVSIERIGDAPPEPLPEGGRPLAGVRVLDLTRVIAGPVCGRTLAAHGADVMLITAPHLYAIQQLVIDTGRGKLSAQLDLREPEQQRTLANLLRESDMLVQGYRPGAIASHGFGPAEAARIRPGLVYVSLSAYGDSGPWGGKRGFDSLVQAATGINAAEAEAGDSDAPKPLPCQALDHASGYLLAFGAMAALHRRVTHGGSWHVRVTLARTGHWLRSLGRVSEGLACPDPAFDDVRDHLQELPSGFGQLTVARDAAELSETPCHWARPSVPLGTHAPQWPKRGA